MKDKGLISIIYMSIPKFCNVICWRGFLITYILGMFVKNHVYIYICFSFSSPLYLVDLHIWFCAGIMLFCLMWLCYTTWTQIFWSLDLFLSGIALGGQRFDVSIWNLAFFKILWRTLIGLHWKWKCEWVSLPWWGSF